MEMEENNNKNFFVKNMYILFYLVGIIFLVYAGVRTFKTENENKNIYFLTKNDIKVSKESIDGNTIIRVDTLDNSNLEYSFDGGKTWQNSSEYLAVENTTYNLVIRKGNELSEVISIKIEDVDNSNPLLSLSFKSNIYVGDYYNIEDSINSIKELSNVKDRISVDPKILDTKTSGEKNVLVTYTNDDGTNYTLKYILPVSNKDGSIDTKKDTNDELQSDTKEDTKTDTTRKTLYRYRIKSNISYECESNDCSYNDENDTKSLVSTSKSTNKCNESYNVDFTFSNGCIFTPRSTSSTCTQAITHTKRYVDYGNYIVDIYALNKDGSQLYFASNVGVSLTEKEYTNESNANCISPDGSVKVNCGKSEYTKDTGDTGEKLNNGNDYKKSPCSSDELEIDGYCHAICSYKENGCPDGYVKSNEKCVRYVKKTCSKTCVTSKWSDWSKWSTSKIEANDYIEVQTKEQ